MKKATFTILLMFVGLLVYSQQLDYKKSASNKKANYSEIVKNTRLELSKLDMKILSNKKAQKQFERWAYLWKDRVYSDGSFPNENLGYFNAGILNKQGKINYSQLKTSTKSSDTWVNIGAQTIPDPNGYPNYPQMGRLNSLLRFPHATDMSQDVLFVGAPTGGVWKSTDGGTNWMPILDNVSGIGVTDVASAAISYSASTVIYVSTGDYDSDQLKSIGVLKSIDGGDTFQSTGLSFSLNDQEVTSNLIVLDDNTVIVGTKYKIYKTTDGGSTWQVKKQSQYDENFGRFVYNATYNEMVCIGQWGDIYYSTDSGENWTTLKIGDGSSNKHALYIDDNYLIAIDMSGQLSYYDYNNSTWQDFGNPVPGYDAQGGYNQTLVLENNMIISGGMNGFHTTDDGATWYRSLNGYWTSEQDSGSYIHSDFHGFGKLDNDNTTYKYWACQDGGLSYIEYASEGAFKPTITYKSEKCIVTQLYSVAITPNSNSGDMLQGNQDNDGFSREMHNGSMQWIAASAGDGTATAIDYNDPQIRYLGGTMGGLTIATNGFSGNYQGDNYLQIQGADFIWPLEMSTVNSKLLYAGGDDVYLIDASDNYSVTALNANTGTVSFISTHNNAIFAIGTDAVKKSLDGGQTWSSIIQCSSDPSATINSIDFLGNKTDTVYATVKSYIDGQKVFKSVDGGQTWTNISGSLPNIVMKEILVAQNADEEILYLATELGVYYKEAGGDWAKMGGSTLPNVIVNDIDINYTEKVLIAATFGRGLWQIDVSYQITGIDNNNLFTDREPNIYPNPIEDILHIDINNEINQKNTNYLIYNVVGGIIKSGKLQGRDNTINVSSLSEGIYMLKLYNDNKSYTKKIIKN